MARLVVVVVTAPDLRAVDPAGVFPAHKLQELAEGEAVEI